MFLILFVFLTGCVTCLDYDEHYILTFPNGYGRQVNTVWYLHFSCLVTHLLFITYRHYMCTRMFILQVYSHCAMDRAWWRMQY